MPASFIKARADINQRLFKNVAANSSEQIDYTPANGEKLRVTRLGGDSSETPDTNVCVVWDPAGTPDILFSTYRDAVHEDVFKEFTGDGTKVLRILLTNDLGTTSYLGGFVQAENFN